MNLLVFDFGGTSIKYGIWVEDKICHEDSFPTPASWEALTSILVEIKNKFAETYELSGAAFSFPGSVDSPAGEIRGLSAIPYIHNFTIKESLAQLLNLPVSMENDANCAALAEAWQGAAKNVNNTLFVVVGTGVGGAVICDGKLQHGNHLYAGEFGYMLVDGKQTLSALGTAVNMAKRYCNRKGVEVGHYSGKEVFELAEQQDSIAMEEVQTFYESLTIGLFNLQTSFDPEVIVIGGGLSANEKILENLQKRLIDLLEEHHITAFKPQVKACHFRNGANLVGAVKNFFDEYPNL